MSDLISRGALYNELNRLEDLARTRVLHTPTNSPCYTRYVAQLNERTALKHLVADAKTAYDVDARNKAIDEFVTMICKHYTEEESKCNYKQYCAEIKQNIADIAEQLKARSEEDAGIYR